MNFRKTQFSARFVAMAIPKIRSGFGGDMTSDVKASRSVRLCARGAFNEIRPCRMKSTSWMKRQSKALLLKSDFVGLIKRARVKGKLPSILALVFYSFSHRPSDISRLPVASISLARANFTNSRREFISLRLGRLIPDIRRALRLWT